MRKLNKDRTVNVVPLQKEQNECLLQRKINVEQRLMECASDPIPVKQVQQLLGQFRSLPLSSPPETQKTISRISSGRFTSASQKTGEA
ncbi:MULTISPECIES: hypothetical protein [Paenibacillus]|uniref:hypothetical protein n=1 Tax=Paenibacillus TaxID=44249 RepID=UPI00096F6BB1|nr:hypothetical protein [Paenibacillus odorifer]OME07089.1 hypothetical protein BSK60_31725 [Paenibacillus odorifer]